MANGSSYAGLGLSAAELKAMTNWPDAVVADYTETLQAVRDIASGAASVASGSGNPEGSVSASGTGLYVNITARTLWFNPNTGSNTGWIQV